MYGKIKLILVGLSLLIVGSLVGLGIAVTQTDPAESKSVLVLFYSLLFVLVLSTFGLIGFWFRNKFGVRERAWLNLIISLRQGSLLGLSVVAAFVLQSIRSLTTINALLLGATIIFLEFYFLSRDSNKQSNQI